jgi:hypothetical protein
LYHLHRQLSTPSLNKPPFFNYFWLFLTILTIVIINTYNANMDIVL